jgi:hypothetical protein
LLNQNLRYVLHLLPTVSQHRAFSLNYFSWSSFSNDV